MTHLCERGHPLAAPGDFCGDCEWEERQGEAAWDEETEHEPGGAQAERRPELDVSNAATMAEWLRYQLGRGPLAGMFARGEGIVHTPREGDDGYVPLSESDDDDDGPAQVRPAGHEYIAARIQYTFDCYRTKVDNHGNLILDQETGQPKKFPALFPVPAARVAVAAADMLPSLRRLAGVVHVPTFRRDGTLIDAPGYDPATRLLYLPEPGLTVPAVPERPTGEQTRAAVDLLGRMIDGFPFVDKDHRANFLGLLLTPMLRTLAPPPYKLGAIEAHQPGSGKTLLANLIRHIHGGVFRAEMPEDSAELRKQITSVLSVTTGSVVVIDNVSGTLNSSILAGLLTSSRWDDRTLGSNAYARCANDRLWIVTGNNLAIGGDLPRRTLRVAIDPGRPRPELRTGFAIQDLEGWVKEHRGELLAALLTLVRAWIVAGRPLPEEHSSDSYAAWVRTVSGILTHAGVPGTFDAPSTQIEAGTDDDEWRTLLVAIHRSYGEQAWTVKEMLARVNTGLGEDLGRPIPLDALPGTLVERIERAHSNTGVIAVSLGKWLRNRVGRWAGDYTVRDRGEDRKGIRLWQIEHVTHTSAEATPGTETAGQTPSAGGAGGRSDTNAKSYTDSFRGESPGDRRNTPGNPGTPGTPDADPARPRACAVDGCGRPARRACRTCADHMAYEQTAPEPSEHEDPWDYRGSEHREADYPGVPA